MADWFLAVVSIFPLELFTTRALNSEADGRFRKILWTIERSCLVGVLAGFVTVQIWLVQIAMAACVTVFLLRALIRFFGLGFARIVRMMGFGLSVTCQVAGAMFVAFVKALPDATAESVESTKESEPALRFTMGGHSGFNYSTGEYDLEPGLRRTSDNS